MITAEDLSALPLFANLPAEARAEFAAKAADVQVHANEYLLHEGDPASFHVLLKGSVGLYKEQHGRLQFFDRKEACSYFGEMPMVFMSPYLVSIIAELPCRLARFDFQHFKEMLVRFPSFVEEIFASIEERVQAVKRAVQAMPTARIQVHGDPSLPCSQSVRSFLRSNRMLFEWNTALTGLSVSVDGVALPGPVTLQTLATGLGMQTSPKSKAYDLVIVGAGPAGMAAGVYGASEGLSTLVVERSAVGGQAGTSSNIENYLGFPTGISGANLSGKALQQARRFNAEIVVVRAVSSVNKVDRCFVVTLDGDETVCSKAVLVASGVEWRLLNAPGIDDLLGRGVFYGASRTEALSLCGKRVFIIGGGNSAGQAAMFLSAYASEVNLLVRGPGLAASMSRYLIDQLAKQSNIMIHTHTTVTEVRGNGQLELLCVRTLAQNGEEQHKDLPADALFIMIGADAKTGWLPLDLERDDQDYVCTGQSVQSWSLQRPPFSLETSIPGLFCAGDVRSTSIKRVASGVGEGSMAVSYIHQYLASLDAEMRQHVIRKTT